MNILNKVVSYVDKAIPGAWNDLDMLEIGNGGMTDTEYVTHMTMWAAVKSAMIMGNDMVNLPPSAYSILLNPAILAVSQDPMGQGAFRRWRYFTPDGTNFTDAGEIQMWSGNLVGGDKLVVLLNAGTRARMMNATLQDIFVDEGGVQSEQYMSNWDLYDLWGNRMPEAVAQSIVEGNSTMAAGMNVTSYYYNATQMSYAEGLGMNDTRLMGTRVGAVQAMGTVNAMVEGHGVMAYRLRMTSGGERRRRDEL